MSRGVGYHNVSQQRLYDASIANGRPTPTVSSAGALINSLHAMGAKRVSIICPYMKPLTKMVVDYIESEGIEVRDFIALEIPDNLEVAAQDPNAPAELWKKLDVTGVDAIIASACVQMPSLPSIEKIEKASGIPTISAAVATTYEILNTLKLKPVAPGGGFLLTER
jgi:maleate isomerase